MNKITKLRIAAVSTAVISTLVTTVAKADAASAITDAIATGTAMTSSLGGGVVLVAAGMFAVAIVVRWLSK